MPQNTPRETSQDTDDVPAAPARAAGRDRDDRDVAAAREDPRPEEGKDYWRAGQEADAHAGDEGIDDTIARSADDVEIKDPNVPVEARRHDVNDRTR